MYEKDKEKAKQKEDILFSLPGFINQLLLLINSGQTLDDSIIKIAKSYEKSDKRESNYFIKGVYSLIEKKEKTGENILGLFYEFSRFSNVKELNRIANLLIENQSKGVDLFEKIAYEGDSLWAERKRLSMEKIQKADTKMALPLGIMLIALIIISAAPAMMTLN